MKKIIQYLFVLIASLAIPTLIFAQTADQVVITHNLGVGSFGAEVKIMQQKLQQMGYFTYGYGKITGFFGPITKQAVKAFQKSMHITATGFVGPLTRQALNKSNNNVISNNQDNNFTGCGINVQVTGATFNPTGCNFLIITPGVPCPSGTDCTEYELQMEDSAAGDLKEVNIIFNNQFKGGTYNYSATVSPNSFNGDLLDKNSTNRNVNQGQISLNSSGSTKENLINIVFNLSFDGGIHINGSGKAGVEYMALP